MGHSSSNGKAREHMSEAEEDHILNEGPATLREATDGKEGMDGTKNPFPLEEE